MTFKELEEKKETQLKQIAKDTYDEVNRYNRKCLIDLHCQDAKDAEELLREKIDEIADEVASTPTKWAILTIVSGKIQTKVADVVFEVSRRPIQMLKELRLDHHFVEPTDEEIAKNPMVSYTVFVKITS